MMNITMKTHIIGWFVLSILVVNPTFSQAPAGKKNPGEYKEKTTFQTRSQWMPEIDVRSDMAIIYGAFDRPGITFNQRVQSWREQGYRIGFMTGIAWGGYQDYFLGRWDEQNHLGVGQVNRYGDTLWHGKSKKIPYIVPVTSFINYMKTAIIKKVIDAGITSIFLEEPEFWAAGGYSKVFKEEWQKYYGFPWRAQHESPENTYLSNKLKYQLYYNAIKEVSAYAKKYGKARGLEVRVYIATHSLVNYSSWKIVSPEASLASLPSIDGYIAQVWTGTSRTPVYYNGKKEERVFENAFLEYGSMVSMTAPTKRKLFFLMDPIEDRHRDWEDYKKNYQATFTAALMFPRVADYEVMPWPERIYTRPYKLANSDEEVLIPGNYATQMQIMVNALNNIPVSENKISGSKGIGILMGNSLMFQRFPIHDGYEDPQFSNFYGQTISLLKLGVPVKTVHMENLNYAESLKDIKVLIVSYSNMKPISSEVNHYLADWVNEGGVMIYCGRDDDPYQGVKEWWNSKGNHYAAPSEQLFQLLKIKSGTTEHKFNAGKGKVYILRKDPKEFVMETNGGNHFIDIVKQAYENDAQAGELEFKNSFYVARGPYDIISVMKESIRSAPYIVNEPVINLFDPELPVLTGKTVLPGEQAFLYNLGRITNKKRPQVLASASRIYDEEVKANTYSFVSRSPKNTNNSLRILLPEKPKIITLTNTKEGEVKATKISWDERSHTSFISFENDPDGTLVTLKW